MNHLTPDELVDAVEGRLAPNRQAHLQTCVGCREESTRLAALLRETRELDVPEPPPFFWDRFSARVREVIAADEPSRGRPGLGWLRWPVIVPVGTIALLVFALATAITRAPGRNGLPAAVDPVGGSTALDSLADDEAEWAIVSELLVPMNLDTAHEAGIAVSPGTAERAALDLSPPERQELIRLLTAETERLGG